MYSYVHLCTLMYSYVHLCTPSLVSGLSGLCAPPLPVTTLEWPNAASFLEFATSIHDLPSKQAEIHAKCNKNNNTIIIATTIRKPQK